VKLRQLHAGSATDFLLLREDLAPKHMEGMQALEKMVKSQGVDPTKFLVDVRRVLDPDAVRETGARESAEEWVKRAEVGAIRRGRLFGVPVEVEKLGSLEKEPEVERLSAESRFYGIKHKVTILEAVIAESLLNEDWAALGRAVWNNLRDMILDIEKGDEKKFIVRDLDEFPQLAALQRYAKRAKGFIYDDERFWHEVGRAMRSAGLEQGLSRDKIPGAEEVRERLMDTYERLEQANESIDKSEHMLLAECVIVEASISDLLIQMGVKPEMAAELMKRHNVSDQPSLFGPDAKPKITRERPRMMPDEDESDIGDAGEMTRLVAKVRNISPKELEGKGQIAQYENREFAYAVIKLAAFELRKAVRKYLTASPEEEAAGEEVIDAEPAERIPLPGL
jgi:hypothetical protein